MPTVSIIAAISENYVIGDSNRLVWEMPSDFEYYKNTVRNKAIIMGRKTAESGDMFFSKEQNILITRNKSYHREGFDVTFSLENAVKLAKGEEIFVTGGEQIYKIALPIADKLYITRIHTSVEGDAFFPKFNENDWILAWEEAHHADKHNPFDYTFQKYIRKATLL